MKLKQTMWSPTFEESLAFSDDEAGLHGWDSERKLLQATRGAHVPVPLATTTASSTAMSWRPTSLDTPQQIRYNFCSVLSLIRGPHDLCYPVWCAAIIYWVKRMWLVFLLAGKLQKLTILSVIYTMVQTMLSPCYPKCFYVFRSQICRVRFIHQLFSVVHEFSSRTAHIF